MRWDIHHDFVHNCPNSKSPRFDQPSVGKPVTERISAHFSSAGYRTIVERYSPFEPYNRRHPVRYIKSERRVVAGSTVHRPG